MVWTDTEYKILGTGAGCLMFAPRESRWSNPSVLLSEGGRGMARDTEAKTRTGVVKTLI